MKKIIKIVFLFIIISIYISYVIPFKAFCAEYLKVYSESAVLLEQSTGKVLFKKNAHKKMYPASTTKILTCIIALEECDLNEKAIASEESVSRLTEGYTKANIVPGEEFTIEQLLLLTMLQSANEAANVVAEHISGTIEDFAELMNKRAKEIGCLNSHFVNPNGETGSVKTFAAVTSVRLSKTSYTYNGKKQKTSVTVTDAQQKRLKEGADYTLAYPANPKNTGIYTVTIRFKGNYSGTETRTFQILPKKMKIARLSAGKKSFTIKWSRQTAMKSLTPQAADSQRNRQGR